MTFRIALGSADATIAMAIADKTKLREIEIFIYGLSISREAKGGIGSYASVKTNSVWSAGFE